MKKITMQLLGSIKKILRNKYPVILILFILTLLSGFVIHKKYPIIKTKLYYYQLTESPITKAKEVSGTNLKKNLSTYDDNKDFYFINMDEDYKFDEYLSQGGSSDMNELADYISSNLLKEKPLSFYDFGFCCTTVAGPIKNNRDEQNIVIRNLDLIENITPMVITTDPQDGYASISTCLLNMINELEMDNGDGTIEKDDLYLLKALPYLPIDGINEKGLSVNLLYAPLGEQEYVTKSKIDLGLTTLIRLLLDNASNVENAISLLQTYNIHTDIGTANFHLHLADLEGNSAIIELIDNKVSIVKKDPSQAFQVATNVISSPGKYFHNGDSLDRQLWAEQLLQKYDNSGIGIHDVFSELLPCINQTSTRYTVIYTKNSDDNVEAIFVPYKKQNFNFMKKRITLE